MKKSKSKTKRMAAAKRGAKKNKRERESLNDKHLRRKAFLDERDKEKRRQEAEIEKILASRPTY